MLYILEDILTILFPYLIGMIIMAIIALAGLQHTGYFEPPAPPISLYQHYQADSLPFVGGHDVKSPLVLAGSFAVVILFIGYFKLT